MTQPKTNLSPKKLFVALRPVVLTLWVGALWTIGYLVVPVLFDSLEDRQLAGRIAGRLFQYNGLIGIFCALYLLGCIWIEDRQPVWASVYGKIIIVMMTLGLVIHFGIQPEMNALKGAAAPGDVMESTYRGRFMTLHAVSSILYLLESLLGVWLLICHRRQQ